MFTSPNIHQMGRVGTVHLIVGSPRLCACGGYVGVCWNAPTYPPSRVGAACCGGFIFYLGLGLGFEAGDLGKQCLERVRDALDVDVHIDRARHRQPVVVSNLDVGLCGPNCRTGQKKARNELKWSIETVRADCVRTDL